MGKDGKRKAGPPIGSNAWLIMSPGRRKWDCWPRIRRSPASICRAHVCSGGHVSRPHVSHNKATGARCQGKKHHHFAWCAAARACFDSKHCHSESGFQILKHDITSFTCI